MPAPKNNEHAKGKGAVQTGSRPARTYYIVSFSARFEADDDTGRELKRKVKQHYVTDKEFLVDVVGNLE